MVCFYLQEIFMILNIYDEIGLFKNIYIYITMVWVQIPSREEQKFDSSKI